MSGNVPEEPVLELFRRLRGAGLELGPDEYFVAVRALRAGLGFPLPGNLANLLSTVWATSCEERDLIRRHCEQLAADLATRTPRPVEPDGEVSEKPVPDDARDDVEPDEPTDATESEGTTRSLGLTVVPAVTAPGLRGVSVPPPSLLGGVRTRPPSGEFDLEADPLPIRRRHMKQSWRNFRIFLREGPKTAIDVEATVREVARTGVFLEPALVARRINRAEALLVVDEGGSMTPFHALSRRLEETALRGGRVGRTGIAYFHNVPGEFLYRDRDYREAEKIEDVLDRLRPDRSAILVVSDAGAARGRRNLERFEATLRFLAQARRHTRSVAWINPVPRERWPQTTAVLIEKDVAMFPLDRTGLAATIRLLQRRSV